MEKVRLNRESGIPLHLQIEKILTEEFANDKKYMAAKRLPSERKLAEIFNVHRITLRKAIESLKKKKILVSKQGKGTFFGKNVASILKFPLDFAQKKNNIYFNGIPHNTRLQNEIILQFRHCESVDTLSQYNPLFSEFRKKYQYVNLSINTFENYHAGLYSEIETGNIPDVFYITSEHIPILAKKEIMIPLDKLMDKDMKTLEFYPQMTKQILFNGKNWILPKGFTTNVLFYNKDMFDDKKIKYPDDSWTWQTYLEAAEKLTDRKSKQYGSAYYCDYYGIPNFIWSNGGDITTADGKKATIMDKKTVDAIQFVIDLTNKYKITPPVSEFGSANNESLFINGKTGLFVSACWTAFMLLKHKNLRWDVAAVPKGSTIRTSNIFVGGYAISKKCKYPEIAWELVKLIGGLKGTAIFAANGNDMPAIKNKKLMDVFLDSDKTIKMNTFFEMLEFGRTWAANGGFLPFIGNDLIELFNECFNNKEKSVRDLVSEMQPKFQLGLDKFFSEIINTD